MIIDNIIEQSIQTITKQYLGAIIKVERPHDHIFYFKDHTSSVEVKVVSDSIIRIKMAPQDTFLEEFSYATQPYEFKEATIEFAETETHFKIATSQVVCLLEKATFKVSFEDKATSLLIMEDQSSMHWEENVDFGGYYVYCSKNMQEGESFFGVGDKAMDFNLRGKRVAQWNSDTYAFAKGRDPLYRTIPFYIGLHHGVSYGLFFDNTFKSFFDFGAENDRTVSFWADGGELQYYYIHGPHMMDVVKRYSYITGTHPMPPMWALGFHQCRWSYYPESKVKDLARTFREKQIPCDALYLDIDYMDGYRCFTWNESYFPDPKRMISELKEDGFRTVVIIDPGIKVDKDYWVFQQGKKNHYFCRRSDDYFMEGPVWPGRCQFPDFTNPEVREWWGTLFKEYVEIGVAGVWNDMNEPAVFGTETFPSDVRHNFDGHRGSHRKAHNVYGMQMVRATYEGLKKLQKNKRPFTITRAGYSGMQRYASTWTGDNVATWEHLQLASIMQQRLSISGVSFSGSDIGGFSGEPDGELFTRWIQVGTFSPLMRVHSAGDTAEREPWSYGPYYEAICKKFIELRYKLLPYLYSAFWEHHKHGFPIIRPVVMHEQSNHANTARQDEFTFGDKILICPVVQQGATSRMVYLPKGQWYNYWTHQVLDGGEEHHIEAPLDIMPIFVKAGSVIPEYPLMQYTGEFDLKQLKLNMYYIDGKANSFMYEDHGDTFAYEQSIYTEKRFYLEGTAKKLSIDQSSVGLYTPRYDTYDVKVYGLPFAPKKVSADNQPEVDFTYDKKTQVLEFVVLKSFTKIDIS
jgi:alpha-glucosidase